MQTLLDLAEGIVVEVVLAVPLPPLLLWGVGTVRRVESGGWSMAKWLKASNK